MKPIIEPVDTGKEWQLIKHTPSNDIGSDFIKKEVIGRGFIPYLMWMESVNDVFKGMPLLDFPSFTKERLFNEYFERALKKCDIGKDEFPAPSDEEIKERFKAIHLQTEQAEFKLLPDEFKKTQERTDLFNDYLKWLKCYNLNKIEELKTKKNKQTFEGLFKDSDNARKVKEIFKFKGYTVNDKWQGHSNNKNELLCAYYVLKPLLKPGFKDTPSARIFYSEFGLPENYISIRMMTIKPKQNDIWEEFEIIFSDLLPPEK